MNRKKIIALVLLLSTTILFGQRKENRDKIEALRIAYITERLDLFPEQAQQFWPIYNVHQKKMNEYRKEERKKIFTELEDIASLSNSDAETLLQKHISIQEKKHRAERQYLKQLSSVLSAKKIFVLLKTEHAFKRRLLKQYRKKQAGKQRQP